MPEMRFQLLHGLAVFCLLPGDAQEGDGVDAREHAPLEADDSGEKTAQCGSLPTRQEIAGEQIGDANQDDSREGEPETPMAAFQVEKPMAGMSILEFKGEDQFTSHEHEG